MVLYMRPNEALEHSSTTTTINSMFHESPCYFNPCLAQVSWVTGSFLIFSNISLPHKSLFICHLTSTFQRSFLATSFFWTWTSIDWIYPFLVINQELFLDTCIGWWHCHLNQIEELFDGWSSYNALTFTLSWKFDFTVIVISMARIGNIIIHLDCQI